MQITLETHKHREMKSFKTASKLLILLLVTSSFLLLRYYSFIFARQIEGQIVALDLPASTPQESFSFMIAIQTKAGDIFVATSEDRQWKMAQKGQCVVAKYFPYAPWQMDKFGSYHGAKLLKLFDCKF